MMKRAKDSIGAMVVLMVAFSLLFPIAANAANIAFNKYFTAKEPIVIGIKSAGASDEMIIRVTLKLGTAYYALDQDLADKVQFASLTGTALFPAGSAKRAAPINGTASVVAVGDDGNQNVRFAIVVPTTADPNVAVPAVWEFEIENINWKEAPTGTGFWQVVGGNNDRGPLEVVAIPAEG